MKERKEREKKEKKGKRKHALRRQTGYVPI
jgi:hypothetical protein